MLGIFGRQHFPIVNIADEINPVAKKRKDLNKIEIDLHAHLVQFGKVIHREMEFYQVY